MCVFNISDVQIYYCHIFGMSGKWFAKASQDREYFNGFPSSKGSVSEIEMYILAPDLFRRDNK